MSVNFAFECGMVQIRERDVSPATVKIQLRLDPKAQIGPSSGDGGPAGSDLNRHANSEGSEL